MRLVISDTGPINYLVLIGYVDILPALFEKIIMPFNVREELSDPNTQHPTPNTPRPVREWIALAPDWLEVREPLAHSVDDDLSLLGQGEREAIRLAVALHADLLLMDDREGVKAALRKGLDTIGILGVLDEASRKGLLDLADAFVRLRRTNFRYPEDVMQALLARQTRKGKPGT